MLTVFVPRKCEIQSVVEHSIYTWCFDQYRICANISCWFTLSCCDLISFTHITLCSRVGGAVNQNKYGNFWEWDVMLQSLYSFSRFIKDKLFFCHSARRGCAYLHDLFTMGLWELCWVVGKDLSGALLRCMANFRPSHDVSATLSTVLFLVNCIYM